MKLEWDFSELLKFADNLQSADLENTFKRITKDISKALLKRMKALTPVGDTYELINGWNGNHFAVKEVADGYEVLIVNNDPKALWVNDGHKAYNQYGGPYKIKHRVKVPTPYKWQKGDATWYVFGHFFVERSIVQLKESKKIEDIILQELHKWWEGA